MLMWISLHLDSHGITTKHLYLTSFFCFRHVFMFPSNNTNVIQTDILRHVKYTMAMTSSSKCLLHAELNMIDQLKTL
jgi:hypothetical protein